MERQQQRFAPRGALALNPKAFGDLFDMPDVDGDADAALTPNDVAVVTIRGPLMHHREWCFDSYESIRDRVAAALALRPRYVLLAIDSPGGLVSGAFDTARDLRKMAEAAGVDLYAHVEGQATSAAYALATAAHWIGVSQSAAIGSIGVIDTMVDATAQNEMLGLNVAIVTSGDRKADGNPNVAISDDALAVTQDRVDTLAGMFFDLVTDHGWGGTRDRVEALQASILTGEQAVQLGLATEVATLEQSIAFATSPAMRTGAGAESTEGKYTMADPMEDAVASLRKAAESDDEEEAKKARAALKALGFGDEDEGAEDEDAEGDDEDAEGDDEDAKAAAKAKAEDEDAEDEDAKAAAKAADDDEDAKAEDDEDAKASSKALAMAARALAKVHNLEASARNEKRTQARAAIIAKRPDISPDMVSILSDPKMSHGQVKKILGTLKVGPARADRVAAIVTTTGTRGASQGNDRAARLDPDSKATLDAAMGLTQMSTEVVNTPTRLSFGVRVPVTRKGS